VSRSPARLRSKRLDDGGEAVGPVIPAAGFGQAFVGALNDGRRFDCASLLA